MAPKTLRELYIQRRRWCKGSILTLYKYRNLILNREYGDFGIYQLPSLVFGVFSYLFVIIFFTNYAIKPIIENTWELIKNFDLIDTNISFDIINLLLNYTFSTDFAKLFIIVVFFLIALILVIKAHKGTKESLKMTDIFPLAVFFVIYYIIISFIWLGAMIELVFKGEGRW